MDRLRGARREGDGGLNLPKGLLVVVALMILLAAGAYTTGTQLEGNDAFCASCHVEPETTYYEQSLARARPPTLAALHAGEETRCIDCHSGRWIPGRAWAQWIGLGNLLAYHSGDISQPAQTTQPVGDVSCTKCHRDLNWVRERPGHYHSPVLRRQWQAKGGPANTCAACHTPHVEVSEGEKDFLNENTVEAQCDDCHDS